MTGVESEWYCKTEFIALMSHGGEVWAAAGAGNRSRERQKVEPMFRGHRGLGVMD